MTGLDRKEIRKILTLVEKQEEHKASSPDRIAKILSAWHSHPAYIDQEKQPHHIPPHGPAPSFEHLAKEYGGDMPMVTMLKELKRSKTVIEQKNGML